MAGLPGRTGGQSYAYEHMTAKDLNDQRNWNKFLRPTLSNNPYPARDWYNEYPKGTPLPNIPAKTPGQKLAGYFYPWSPPSSLDSLAPKSAPSQTQTPPQKKTGPPAGGGDPQKTHSYTNADYVKWAKKYGLPGTTSTSANGPESGINKAAAERAAAKQTAENATPSTEALYQYLFLVDTLRKIDSDPKMAANMDPAAKQALRAMVQAQSQQMLVKAIGAGNAARLADLSQQRSDANRWGGWTGNAAPGAAAAYMQQTFLPQMTAQHQAALQYAQQNPTALPNGMSSDAYTNLSTEALNAVQAAPAQQVPPVLPSPVPAPAGALDATQGPGFSVFDNTTPFTNPYAAAYTP